MKVSSIIANNSKCGANFVHYLLAKNSKQWIVASLRGNGKLYDLDIVNFCLSRFQLLFQQKTVLKKIELELKDSDVILSDGLLSYFYSKKLRAQYPKKKYYALVHNDYTIDNRTNWNFVPNAIFNILYDNLLKDIKVITTSKSAYDSLSKRGLNVVAIDNAVSLPSLSDRKVIEDNIVNYWYIGRLVKIKQVDILLKAFSKLPSNCKLNIVGSGDQSANLKALSEKLEINCKFYGHSDKPFFDVSRGDIFVLPSLVEGRSIALMEAILAGCCCLVSDIDANSEFRKYGAITFDVNSESDLYSKLLQLSRSTTLDRIDMMDFESAADDFSVKSMINKYTEIFNEKEY